MTPKFDKNTLKDVHVTNIMEKFVDDEFPVVMQKFPNACCCAQCLSDIKALTLNNIKPRYVSTDKGGVYERVNLMDMMVKVDALRAMTEAAEKVTNNPRHPKLTQYIQ